MGKTTEYLGLYEPYDSDFYDVDRDQNENFTILDNKAKEVDGIIKNLGNNKQDKTDNSLNTENKTVAGAINELNRNKLDSNKIETGEFYWGKIINNPIKKIYFTESHATIPKVFITSRDDIDRLSGGGTYINIREITKTYFIIVADTTLNDWSITIQYLAIEK